MNLSIIAIVGIVFNVFTFGYFYPEFAKTTLGTLIVVLLIAFYGAFIYLNSKYERLEEMAKDA